jgi:hypothetical protein
MKFRHRANPVKLSDRILILCEGEKTEPTYFKAIKADKMKVNKLSGLRIELRKTKKNTAKELVDEAISLKREAARDRNPYKEVWVVFDKDSYSRHPEVFDRAKATGIFIAFSSPCFEFWYFLHFKHSTAAISNAAEMTRKLKEHIPDYDKAENYYEKLKPLTDTAIYHGNKVVHYWNDVGDGKIWEYNPYTDVSELVEKLLSL